MFEPARRASSAWQRVIEVEKIEDPQAEYDALKDVVRLPVNKLFDRHALQDQMNEASANSHRARLLFLEIKKRAEQYERAVRPELAALRRTALKRLTDWVRVQDASRRKTVTDEMVLDQLADSPDLVARYNEVMDNLGEMAQVMGAAESLAHTWRDRMWLLQKMADALPKMAREREEEPR